jgi:hypothetical protein
MATTICPRCQYSNPSDHLYCENCGTRLPDDRDAEVGSAHRSQSPPGNQEAPRQEMPQGPPTGAGPDRPSEPYEHPQPLASEMSTPPKSRLSLWMVLLAGGAVMFCGLFALVAVLLVWGSDDSADTATDGTPAISAADLEPFRPNPAGGEPSISGETVSSDSGTVTAVLPSGAEWDVLSTEGGFISLEHSYGFMEIGVYRSDFPTTPGELMDEEVEWMQEDFSGAEVIVGPEHFEFENGNGVMFAMAYDIDLLVLDIPELDVYALGVDSSGIVVIWVNFYGLADEWDEFAAAVEPVVQSIRSPLFE